MSTTLLAVDDSVTMRKVLEITFAGEGYRFVSADGPETALQKARAERPAVVVLDVSVSPSQDGYAVCKSLKAEHPSIGVVLLASKQRPYDAAKGAAAGADDGIDKPFDTQTLLEKVRKVVAAKAAAAAEPPRPAIPPSPPAPLPTPAPPAISASSSAPPAVTLAPTTEKQATIDDLTDLFTLDVPERASTPTRPLPPGVPPQHTQTLVSGHVASASSLPPAPSVSSLPLVAAPPSSPLPAVDAAPSAPSAVAAPPSVMTSIDGHVNARVAALGLTPAQADAVLALSREVVERVVWEVVPQLAEALIKEEIQRLTREG